MSQPAVLQSEGTGVERVAEVGYGAAHSLGMFPIDSKLERS